MVDFVDWVVSEKAANLGGVRCRVQAACWDLGWGSPSPRSACLHAVLSRATSVEKACSAWECCGHRLSSHPAESRAASPTQEWRPMW